MIPMPYCVISTMAGQTTAHYSTTVRANMSGVGDLFVSSSIAVRLVPLGSVCVTVVLLFITGVLVRSTEQVYYVPELPV